MHKPHMDEPNDRELLVKFREHLIKIGLSRATVANYVADVRLFADWLTQTKGAPDLFSELTGSDIQHYCFYLQTTEGKSISTINRHLQSIRKLCQFAVNCGLMHSDPSTEVKLLKRLPSAPPRVLDHDEIVRLVQAVQKGRPSLVKRDCAIIQMLLQTGIRVGELAHLRLSDVQLSEESGSVTVWTAKGDQYRSIPLNTSVRKALNAYLEVHPMSAINDNLFLTSKGKPLSVRSIQQIVSTYARIAGLTDVSANVLRNSYATHLLRDTGDLELVSRLLGHRRLEAAAKYISPRVEDATEVVERSSLNIF